MAYINKQKVIPTNINYVNKDFSTIKADLIEYTKSYFPDTYKDFNETSPGMMLIELSSYVGDVLSYYIDYNYKENMLATATEKRNVRRLAEFIGYKADNKTPSVVNLKTTINITANDDGDPDYSVIGDPIDSGLQVASNIDAETIFETTEIIDFSISGSADPVISAPILDDNGEATGYTLTRNVRAVSGKTQTKSFTVGSPTKFLELDLGVDNVIEVLDCKDASGQTWHQVEYLAQQRILKGKHYKDGDSNRTSAYDQGSGSLDASPIPIPYVAQYIRTNKKFMVSYDIDSNSYKIQFGNGLFRHSSSGSLDAEGIVEQQGITINGSDFSTSSPVGSLLGNSNNLNLGEIPTNTVMTLKYRVGGGQSSNIQINELTDVVTAPDIGTATNFIVTNDYPGVGGTDGQTVNEIRNNASAFFSTQLRCVTKEDYQARILNLPARYGNIAKCYVERLDSIGTSAPTLFISLLSYNRNKNLVQTPQLVCQNVALYLNQYRMINDMIDIGFKLPDQDGSFFSSYIINFAVNFEVNYDRRFNPVDVKVQVINTIKDFFKVDKVQYRQSINKNDLEYAILGLEGVIGIQKLELVQDIKNRALYYYRGNGEIYSDNDSTYGFQYNFEDALTEDGIYRPSVTPSVFELKDPSRDIYGKLV